MNPLSWVYRDRTINWPRVLLVALLVAVVAGIGVFATTSSAGFGPFNPTWDGTSEFRATVADDPETELMLAAETAQYDEVEPTETVAFVLAPDEQYGNGDVARVRQFVENGGTLVVMENFGDPGNTLLADIGARARIDGQLVRDERNHDEAPTMPIATRSAAGNHTLTTGVEQLTLNYAATIEPNNATVLVRTSEFSYRTESEEATLADDTELASYPVATVEDVDNGTVVAVSDPSIVINVMLDRPDNAAFVQHLATQGETVLFDLSHSESLPPLTAVVVTLRSSSPGQALAGLSVVVLTALAAESRLRSWFERTVWEPALSYSQPQSDDYPHTAMSEAELAEHLRRTYPDWDEERIRRVITAFTTDHLERGSERDS